MFWSTVAHMLARWFWLQNLVIGSAMKRPYFHLPGYMDRWWLLPGAAADSKESKYRPPWWLRRFPISIRLHHIKRPDGDRNLHDHPCDFRSIVLAGYYVETREDNYFRTNHWRHAGETYFSKAEQYHSIIGMPSEGVWTLWIMYPKKQSWGFLVNGKKVPRRKYLKERENE